MAAGYTWPTHYGISVLTPDDLLVKTGLVVDADRLECSGHGPIEPLLGIEWRRGGFVGTETKGE